MPDEGSAAGSPRGFLPDGKQKSPLGRRVIDFSLLGRWLKQYLLCHN